MWTHSKVVAKFASEKDALEAKKESAIQLYEARILGANRDRKDLNKILSNDHQQLVQKMAADLKVAIKRAHDQRDIQDLSASLKNEADFEKLQETHKAKEEELRQMYEEALKQLKANALEEVEAFQYAFQQMQEKRRVDHAGAIEALIRSNENKIEESNNELKAKLSKNMAEAEYLDGVWKAMLEAKLKALEAAWRDGKAMFMDALYITLDMMPSGQFSHGSTQSALSICGDALDISWPAELVLLSTGINYPVDLKPVHPRRLTKEASRIFYKSRLGENQAYSATSDSLTNDSQYEMKDEYDLHQPLALTPSMDSKAYTNSPPRKRKKLQHSDSFRGLNLPLEFISGAYILELECVGTRSNQYYRTDSHLGYKVLLILDTEDEKHKPDGFQNDARLQQTRIYARKVESARWDNESCLAILNYKQGPPLHPGHPNSLIEEWGFMSKIFLGFKAVPDLVNFRNFLEQYENIEHLDILLREEFRYFLHDIETLQ